LRNLLFESAARTSPRERCDAIHRSGARKPWSVTVAKTTVSRGTLALTDETSTFQSTLADVTRGRQ
jgi:hypothetical protein